MIKCQNLGVTVKKSTSLINSLTIKILFIFLFFAIVSGIIIIYNQNLDLKKRSDAIHTSLLKDAKQLLQDEIARALGFIDSEYKEADLRVKKELEDEMKSFLGYLSSAYEFLNKKDDLLSIYALLDEHKTPSCKNINFTIFNKDGTPIFHDKKLEEDAIEEMSNGVFSKIEQADEWLINHAIKGENVEKKLSKIAKFDPLDWVVVGTIDLTLFEKEVKEHIFRQLAQWRFGVHGINYFFVNSFDGNLIFSNGVYYENPLNVWEAEGENIGYISKQNSLIAQNEKEGGFNIYSWKNLDNKSVEKISFIKKIPNEEMFIGAGIDMNIVKKSALKQSNILKNMIEKRIYWLISLFTLAAILTYIFMFILAGRIKKTLNVFIKVFEKAATEQVNIDEKSVIYSEFKPLAISVNKMIIALKEQQKKIFHNANHDYLTALPNRLLLSDRLEHAILHAKRLKTRIAVMFLDLDFFKRINDSLGHEAGDMVLKSVSSRLLGVIRESDTLARFGGDEFVLIVPYIENDEFVYELIKRILEAINRPFYIDGKNISIGCSIGVAFYPEDGEGADILIKNADIAMYEAKQKGRNTFQLFNSKMDEKIHELLEIEQGIKLGIVKKEFELYFQPKVDIITGNIIGAEALLRWNHPTKGILSPDHFIAVAEESGLILTLGEWVVKEALAQCKKWHENGWMLTLAINLSTKQLESPFFISCVKKALEESGINPKFIEFEITESFSAQSIENIKILNGLKALGVRIAIDDFGTGYSSLSYLYKLPIDIIKIDKSFIIDIDKNIDKMALVETIIQIARIMDFEVVAEGVETNSDLEALKNLKCQKYQGFLTSKPLPLSLFNSLVLNKIK